MNLKQKKILLVTFSDNPDHQDITFSMYEELYPKYDAWLLAIKEPKAELKKFEHAKLVNCPKRPGICKKTFDLKTLFSIIAWIRQEKFDVIFFETLHVWNLPIMLKCHKNTHIYQMIHDLIPHDGDKQARLVDLMNRVVCKIADTIVLCNQKYLQKVSELYQVPQESVAYIDMWRRFPEYVPPKHTGRVLFFGRINPYKGADNLLEIVRLCPNIQFDVVGRVDPQMEDLVQKLGQKDNVTLNNSYVTDEDMANAFINADWIILPYNSATQSGVVIDAYRYARPVIAFDVGAIAEQVKPNVSGYLIPAGSNQKFADTLMRIARMDHTESMSLS